MRQKLALTALAALAAASSTGGPDDAEAALRNLLTSLRPVYSKWKEAETPEQQPPAPPAVGAAPWVRAATDLRDATPADVALAALYEGNVLDCALYEAAAARLGGDLAGLAARGLYVDAVSVAASAHCRRGAAALARLSSFAAG